MSHPNFQPRLTPKQEQFCREYLIDLNATKAALRAGYSRKTAKEIGHENLTKPHLSNRIATLKQESVNRVKNNSELEITADAVLAEIARIAFFRPEDFAVIDPITNRLRYLVDITNIHKLAGITALKIKEAKPIKVVEAGIELEREVVEIEFRSDKLRALEALMRHLGLMTPEVEVNGLGELVLTLQRGRERVANRKNFKNPLP